MNREPAAEAGGGCLGHAPLPPRHQRRIWSQSTAQVLRRYCGRVRREGPPHMAQHHTRGVELARGNSRSGHSLEAPAPHCAALCGAPTRSCWICRSPSCALSTFQIVELWHHASPRTIEGARQGLHAPLGSTTSRVPPCDTRKCEFQLPAPASGSGPPIRLVGADWWESGRVGSLYRRHRERT